MSFLSALRRTKELVGLATDPSQVNELFPYVLQDFKDCGLSSEPFENYDSLSPGEGGGRVTAFSTEN